MKKVQNIDSTIAGVQLLLNFRDMDNDLVEINVIFPFHSLTASKKSLDNFDELVNPIAIVVR